MIMHKELANGRWFELSLIEQLANVGSDVIRAINWKRKGNSSSSEAAFMRALDLIHLTVLDPKNRTRLKEVIRSREALIDFFWCDNIYGSTDELWENYFLNFNYMAAIQRGR